MDVANYFYRLVIGIFNILTDQALQVNMALDWCRDNCKVSLRAFMYQLIKKN